MMRKNIHKFWIICTFFLTLSTIILCTDVSEQVNAVLEEFVPNKNQTDCHQHLLQGDTIVILGNVTFNDSIKDEHNDIKSLLKIWKKKNTCKNETMHKGSTTCCIEDTTAEEKMYFQQCNMSSSNSTFYCRRESHLIKTVYKAKVDKTFDEAFLQLEVIYNEIKFCSNYVKLPKVYNLTEIRMVINGKMLELENLTIDLYDTSITLCCSDAPLPCVAEITPPISPTIRNASCVNYNHTSKASANFTLGFQVCNSTMNSIAKLFTVNFHEKDNNTDDTCAIVGGVLGGILLIIIILVVIVYKCCFAANNDNSRRQNRRAKDGKSSTELDNLQQPSGGGD